MMAQHTPTPWKAETKNGATVTIRQDVKLGRPIAEIWHNGDDPEANAAFIVRAVNAHDEMLKALKEAVEPLQLYQAYGWPDRGGVIRKLQAAIARAEGSE